MIRRFEHHSDLEAFLSEIAGTLALEGMPGYRADRETLFVRAAARMSLKDRWVAHLEGLGESFIHLGSVRTALHARDVEILGVRCGRLDAAHGKLRVEVEVEVVSPGADDRVEAVRAYLDDRVREGRTGLRDALRDAIARWPDALLPARRTMIHTRCTCGRTAAVCKHALAVLVAFANRLDAEPELLVRLRGLEALDMSPGPLPAEKRELTGDLAAIFDIELMNREAAPEAVPASVPPSAQTQVQREHLRVLGLRSRTIDAWRRQGILGRTDRPDVYVRTPEANRRIARFLAR